VSQFVHLVVVPHSAGVTKHVLSWTPLQNVIKLACIGESTDGELAVALSANGQATVNTPCPTSISVGIQLIEFPNLGNPIPRE
jgi:hypothetical protein